MASREEIGSALMDSEEGLTRVVSDGVRDALEGCLGFQSGSVPKTQY